MAISKKFETSLFSALGVLGVLVLLVALNSLLSRVPLRADLTADKMFTLSAGTRAILAKLDTPVTLRYYVTESDNAMPVPLRTYAARVEDLLREYQRSSRGLVTLVKLDPQPDSDAEDSATLDGVPGQPLAPGSPSIYLGLSVTCLDKKTAIPFLSPDRERLLEYDLSRAISQVVATSKPIIGVMSALKVNGAGEKAMMMQMMGQNPPPPWSIISELKQNYEVRDLPLDSESIDPAVTLILLIHPQGISDRAQYALDQFILRGGKLIALLDPMSVVSQSDAPANPMMGPPPASSGLPKLLTSWGYTFDEGKILADLTYRFTRPAGNGGPAQDVPAALMLTDDAINLQDIATAQSSQFFLPFAGTFTGKPADGLTETILLKSSLKAQLIDALKAQSENPSLAKEIQPDGLPHTLALRLTGKFKTAFPDGQPKKDAPDPTAPDAPKPPDEKPADPATQLKESAQDTTVILVGDSDFLYDQFSVRVQDVFGQKMLVPLNSNFDIVLNTIDQLSGDSNLIAVRSRGALVRPFTRVRDLQAAAEQKFQSKITELEAELQEASRKVSELQSAKDPKQKLILTPEQQAEIEKFTTRKAEVRTELKQVNRQLNQEINGLENTLKWSNILAMPLLVIVAGLAVAISRKARTAAR